MGENWEKEINLIEENIEQYNNGYQRLARLVREKSKDNLKERPEIADNMYAICNRLIGDRNKEYYDGVNDVLNMLFGEDLLSLSEQLSEIEVFVDEKD